MDIAISTIPGEVESRSSAAVAEEVIQSVVNVMRLSEIINSGVHVFE